MSVSGFSVAHDVEVQLYNQVKAQYKAQNTLPDKAQIRAWKQAWKISRRDMLAQLDAKEARRREVKCEKFLENLRARFSRKAVSVGGNVVNVKLLDDDSDWEGEVEYFEGKWKNGG